MICDMILIFLKNDYKNIQKYKFSYKGIRIALFMLLLKNIITLSIFIFHLDLVNLLLQ